MFDHRKSIQSIRFRLFSFSFVEKSPYLWNLQPSQPLSQPATALASLRCKGSLRMPQSLPMRSFRMLLDGYELGTWDLMDLSICQYDVNMMSICVTYGVTKQMIFGVVWSSFLSSNNHVNGFVVSGDKPGRFGWPEIAIGDANWWMGSRCRCHMCVKKSAGFPSCPLFWCFFSQHFSHFWPWSSHTTPFLAPFLAAGWGHHAGHACAEGPGLRAAQHAPSAAGAAAAVCGGRAQEEPGCHDGVDDLQCGGLGAGYCLIL